MECRTVALIALYAFVGFAIYVWLAIPPGSGWDRSIHWGDVATWAGAIASTAAVIVALHLAGESGRRDERRDKEMSSIIATALCDELRNNRGQVEVAAKYQASLKHSLVDKARIVRDSLASLDITAFRLFRAQLHCLGPEIGEAVATAYVILARLQVIESGTQIPDKANAQLRVAWSAGYLNEREHTCKDVLHEVSRAIVLLWPLTRDPVGTEVPLTNEAETAYAAANRLKRKERAGHTHG